MGWLRELMDRAPARQRSFGTLAREALAHPDWPPGVRPKERSLATLFGKLDREADLEWLAGRGEVQQVLAQVLGVPHLRIQSTLEGRLGRADAARHLVRFIDAPYAAPLLLTEEPLPPGIPPIVSTPAAWTAHHWAAVTGSGRSLAARWLAARGVATVKHAATYEQALVDLPESGPVFIELSSPLPADATPRGRALLVAAPPDAIAGAPRAFTSVCAEPIASWLPDLVTWLGRRLPADGRFDGPSALSLLTRALSSGVVDSFGSALGLASLVDVYGSTAFAHEDLRGVAERFVEDALLRTRSPDSAALHGVPGDVGYSLLVRLAGRLLGDATASPGAPRRLEEWVALVPGELRETVDAEWVRLAVGRASSPSTLREVERALQELPPGAFRSIQSLERAGLLRATEDERLTLAPRWLALHVLDRARAELARGLPEEWGEALLVPADAGGMARRIVARAALLDETLLDDALETDASRSPAATAALEMTFRATGLSLLDGEETPEEGHSLLWDQGLSLTVETPDGPRPRVDYPDAWAALEPLLHVGTYRLAALALSESLPAHRGRRHPLLRPWADPPPAREWTALLDSVWQATGSALEQSWVPGALELFGRLRSLHPDERPLHSLEWPSRIARDITDGSLTWATYRGGATPRTTRALAALSSGRGLSAAQLSEGVWKAWVAAPETIDARSPLWPAAEPGQGLFRHIPRDALVLLVEQPFLPLERLPFELLPEDAWPALEARAHELLQVSHAVAAMPEAVLVAALRSAAAMRTSLSIAWTTAPSTLLSLVDALSRSAREAALHLAYEAPLELTPALVPKIRLLARDATPEERTWLRETLHSRVRSRAPGFREAFAALSDLG